MVGIFNQNTLKDKLFAALLLLLSAHDFFLSIEKARKSQEESFFKYWEAQHSVF